MRCLVTGHSGLIGSHLVNTLLLKKHDAFGISRSNRNENKQCHNYYFDLKDIEASKKVIEKIAPEVVFALAACAAEGKSVFSPIEIMNNNVNVFYNTLVPSINAGKLKRIVFISSIAVYGSIKTPFRETDVPVPQDIYGIAKLTNENSLRILSKVHGFEYVIVRPHNVFGPNQIMNDPYRNVVTLFMNHILQKKPYSIYGDGEMRRGFSYVEDVVNVIYRCGFEDVNGMIFNVGSDVNRSINELSSCIQKITGTSVTPTHLPSRTQEVELAISDHTLVKNTLGYKDTPFDQALEETWKWVKEQGPQEYIYTKLEIPNNLVPKNWKQL